MVDIENRAHDLAIFSLYKTLNKEDEKLDHADLVDLYSDAYFKILDELRDTRDFNSSQDYAKH